IFRDVDLLATVHCGHLLCYVLRDTTCSLVEIVAMASILRRSEISLDLLTWPFWRTVNITMLGIIFIRCLRNGPWKQKTCRQKPQCPCTPRNLRWPCMDGKNPWRSSMKWQKRSIAD